MGRPRWAGRRRVKFVGIYAPGRVEIGAGWGASRVGGLGAGGRLLWAAWVAAAQVLRSLLMRVLLARPANRGMQ